MISWLVTGVNPQSVVHIYFPGLLQVLIQNLRKVTEWQPCLEHIWTVSSSRWWELLNTLGIRMPQVVMKETFPKFTERLRDLLKSWLDCPRFTGLWEISWNLDWTAPGLLDNAMPSPFLIGDFFAKEVSSPLKWFYLLRELSFIKTITVWISLLSNK